jgi:integrase
LDYRVSAAIIQFPERRDENGQLWEAWVDEVAVARHFSASTRSVRRWQARDAFPPDRGSETLSAQRMRGLAPSQGTGGIVSIRYREGRKPIVEVYDPAIKRKRHVKPSDYGLTPPPETASERTWQRFAERLERVALAARDAQAAGRTDETCKSFATRWPDDYVRGKRGRERGESTREHNRERVRAFGVRFADRTLRSIDRQTARDWAAEHPGTVPALRAMFTDAVGDGLAESNPFSRLGIEKSKGREDIIVLTVEEVDGLAAIARHHHRGRFGDEAAGLIIWQAYTCMRPGESFAAQYAFLNGDEYDIQRQFNSRLGKETEPKHNSTGLIYVPDPAQRVVRDKPRAIDAQLIFHGKRGQQLRQESWHRAWDPVRRTFANQLPATHHLRLRIEADETDQLDFYELRHFGASHMLNELQLEPWIIAEQLRHTDGGALVVKLYGHPDRKKTIDRIRRAYTGATVTELRGTTTDRQPARGRTIGGQT